MEIIVVEPVDLAMIAVDVKVLAIGTMFVLKNLTTITSNMLESVKM